LSSFTEAVRQAGRKTQYTTQHRHGAEEARGAHNSEDIGSKPIAGILHHFASNVQDISRTKHHTIQAAGRQSGSVTLNGVVMGSSKIYDLFLKIQMGRVVYHGVCNTF
jgi:hypothetical protein